MGLGVDFAFTPIDYGPAPRGGILPEVARHSTHLADKVHCEAGRSYAMVGEKRIYV